MVFLVVLIIMLISVFSTQHIMERVMLQNTEKALGYLVSDNIQRIESSLQNIQDHAVSIFSLNQSGLLDDECMEIYIEKLLMDNPEIESIYLAYDKDSDPLKRDSHGYYIKLGKLTTLDLNQIGIDYRLRDWFQIPQLTKKEYWSEPWFDADGKGLMVTSYSLPIFGSMDNNVIGVIRIDIALSALQGKMTSSRQEQRGSALLISQSGRIVVHPDDSVLHNETIFSLAEEENDTQLREIGRDMLRGNRGFVKLEQSADNHEQWIFYAPLLLNHWAMGIIFEEEDIFRDLDTLLLILTLFMIGGFLAIAVIISMMAWRINKPLRQLTDATRNIGKGDFDAVVPLRASYNEIRFLADAFINMRDSLKEYMNDLTHTIEEKNRIESDLRIASVIQKNLIPQNNDPHKLFPGLKVYGIVEPAKDIGGDLYDYFRLDDRRFCFVIADVLGKGLVAAMTMTVVNTLIRTKAPSEVTLKNLLLEVNNYLCETQSDSNFVTMIIGVIDMRTGVVEYCNAGHVPMYLRKANRQLVKYSETQATALGIFPNIEIESKSLQLDLGDTIILFTDGITETMSQAEAFFGEERLEVLISGLHNPEPETIVRAILKSVRKFAGRDRQADDTTILVIEYRHPLISR